MPLPSLNITSPPPPALMKLLEFPHSHYCEKARWALDYKQVPFERTALLPGFHMRTVRRHAPNTSVPVLLAGSEAVQGSSEIIDYLESHYPEHQLTVRDPESCRLLEARYSAELGEPVRTILYDRLLAYPDYIRFCFTHPMPPSKRALFRLYYPLLRTLMHRGYVESEQRVAQARQTFNAALDALAAEIGADGYLLEGRFSRVDLSVCALLSVVVQPPEFPLAWPEMPDPEIRALQSDYRNHPVFAWVRRIYQLHR